MIANGVVAKRWQRTGLFILFGCALFLSLCIIFLSRPAHAAQTTPYKINYQGRLTDAAGVAKPNGQYNMKFRIFSAASGGVALWTETRETTNRVTVTNGQFNVQLGDVTALSPSVFTAQPLYFEVELPTPATATCSTAACGTFTEGAMTPRQPVAASAYAMNADTLDGSDASSFIITSQNNTFTGTNLFKNTSDSTSAFDIQTSGGTSLFKVNTTASSISIGTGGGSGGTGPALSTTSTGRVGISTTTPSTTLEVAGNALFKNLSDSTTAFQIQNSSAGSLLIADTTNSTIQIGSPTADATAVVFILDTKNTSGDPSGTNGAMYYNSNAGKMRCYEGGAWTNCIATAENVVTLGSDVIDNTGANTIADVTGLSFAVTSGVTYHFSALINYTAAATTTGSIWTVNGPAATTISYTAKNTLTATTETTNFATAYDTPATANATSLTAGNIATIEGIVTPSANGTLQIRFATEVNGSAITAKAGSTLTWW
ncbi:MAG TPA: hypothetical protein VF281_04565 [Candidatus Saccharimonadales bacterium]